MEYLKNKFINKILNTKLNIQSPTTDLIKKVGLIVDGNHFLQTEVLIELLVSNGIHRDNIQILLFNTSPQKNGSYVFPEFNSKDVGITGKVKNQYVQYFINNKFDLLISYYNKEILSLFLVTALSKAIFKVGFAGLDIRLNQFTIYSDLNDYQIFVKELFKYLKILNKI